MSRILKVGQSNYTVQVQSGGAITLDTGFKTGQVYVSGDLIVEGNTTTVESSTLTVKDNIIYLNTGEAGNGVTLGSAGIQIDRGNYQDAIFTYDETVAGYNSTAYYVPATSSTGHLITLNTTNGLTLNAKIQFLGNVTDTGLTAGADYYIKTIGSGATANRITVSTSLGGAEYTGVLTKTGLSLTVNVLAQFGTWILKTADGALSNLTLKGIVTDATTNFTFDMHNSSNVLRVVNAPGYENYVTQPNDIPNKKFINDYVLAVGGIAIVDRIFKPSPSDPYNSAAGLTQVLADSTNVQFSFNNGAGLVTKAYFSASGLTLNDINVNQTTVTGIGSDNLKLTTLNSTYVEIQKTLELTDQAAMETVVDPGKTKLYSRSDLTTLSQTPGRTGIFFKNTIGGDELISKNRAVLLSILL
jgi:hypothetical protein